jgi:hypothetical protein
MKQEEVQEAIVSVLMQEDGIGFSLLSRKTGECLQETRDAKYVLHDDVFNEALLGLLEKTVYKKSFKTNGRPVYFLAPQRKEENLDKIEKFVDDISKHLENIDKKDVTEVLSYACAAIKNLSQQHKKLLLRKHFEKASAKKIDALMQKIDKVIGEAYAVMEKKEETKLPYLYSSVNYTINQEYLGPSYTCGPYF